MQAPLADDALLGDVEDAHLRGHDHQVIIRDEVAGGPQAIAIQGGADLAAVGEGHRRRAIPGFHEGGMVLVEGAPPLVHQGITGPGLRDQDHHGMGQGIAAHHQQFQGIVEAGGVRLILGNQGPDLFQIRAYDLGGHVVTAGRHPVEVAAQGVDLAIVGDHAEGVGQVPGREGVGGKALMDQGQGRLEQRVMQVPIIGPHLVRQEHTLVNQGPGGQ